MELFWKARDLRPRRGQQAVEEGAGKVGGRDVIGTETWARTQSSQPRGEEVEWACVARGGRRLDVC